MKIKPVQLIQIVLSTVILAVLFASVDTSQLSLRYLSLTPGNIALIMVILVLSLLPRSMRWLYLMNADKSDNQISHLNALRFLLVGTALNHVTPAGVGEVARSYFGYKWTGIKERMVSVSLYDKIIAVSSLSALALGAYFYTRNVLLLVAAVISVGPFLVIACRKWIVAIPPIDAVISWLDSKTKAISLREMLEHFQLPADVVALGFVLSWIGWMLDYSILYLCFELTQLEIDFHTVMAMGPLLTLGRLFPFTLNGVGSDEAIIVFLFATDPSMQGPVLLGALIYRIVMLILPAIVGAYYLLVTRQWPEPRNNLN